MRQALMMATDRDAMVTAVTSGLGVVAHAFIIPNAALFPEVERAIVRYPYDPNRAAALLADAGWQRSPGGNLSNAAGQALDIPIWTTPDGGGEQEAAILTDSWKTVGINSSQFMIPAVAQRDLELRASFPGVNPTSRSATLDNFVFDSGHLPTAAVLWQGANRGSFVDPEVDRLLKLAQTSIDPLTHRDAVVGRSEERRVGKECRL